MTARSTLRQLHSPPPDARATALSALAAVLDRGMPLEAALAAAPGFEALEARDRAFARLLVATVLRRAGEIDAVIDRCVTRPLPAHANLVHHILALGVAQLLFLETPHHAAVDTCVRLTGTTRANPFKSLVNAVLRRITRDGTNLRRGLDAARINTPDWLWRIWERTYGVTATAGVARAHLEEPLLDLTLRDPDKAEYWAQVLDAEILPSGSLRRRPGGAVPLLPGYADGSWWVQDVAAAFPARLVPAPGGKRILDLCAAPGGKTMQLAAAGANVTALDRSAERLAILRDNLRRTGLPATVIEADARTFEAGTPFDAVLVDAPCSATGTLRRHPDIARTRKPVDVEQILPLQDALLAAAARAVRPGGIVVYAVCSLDPAEGEERIASFLAEHPTFRRVPIAATEVGGLKELLSPSGDLRTLPIHLGDRGGMDGFLVTRLQRSDEAGS